jgi:hypothetical protein
VSFSQKGLVAKRHPSACHPDILDGGSFAGLPSGWLHRLPNQGTVGARHRLPTCSPTPSSTRRQTRARSPPGRSNCPRPRLWRKKPGLSRNWVKATVSQPGSAGPAPPVGQSTSHKKHTPSPRCAWSLGGGRPSVRARSGERAREGGHLGGMVGSWEGAPVGNVPPSDGEIRGSRWVAGWRTFAPIFGSHLRHRLPSTVS